MENAVQKVVGAVGTGFAEGLARGLVMVVLVGIALLIISILLGFLFVLGAWVAYRKNKPKLFLTFGILASLSLAIVGGFFTGGALDNPPIGIIFVAPAIFILGIWQAGKLYRKMLK